MNTRHWRSRSSRACNTTPRRRQTMLLHNLGGVFTGDPSAPVASLDALAIADALIASPGANDEAERLDAGGRWAMPGLWDGAQNLYFGDHTPVFSAVGALSAAAGF